MNVITYRPALKLCATAMIVVGSVILVGCASESTESQSEFQAETVTPAAAELVTKTTTTEVDTTAEITVSETQDEPLLSTPETTTEAEVTTTSLTTSGITTPNTTTSNAVTTESAMSAPEPVAVSANPEPAPVTTSTPETAQAATPTITANTEDVQLSGSLTGKVSVLGKNGSTLPPENTIITLHPQFDIALEKNSSDQLIDMADKAFGPRFVTIATHDMVGFKNSDNFKHNVFSSSSDNSFDLGTYGSGKTASHTFDHEGLVKIYCNIHPNMAAFVAVSDYNISHILESDGVFEFKNLPAGIYQLKVWNIRGSIEETVELFPNQDITFNVTLDTASYQHTQHKNKFGKDYKKSLLEDEFY